MHLRTLRKRRGWTQVELCRRSKIAQNSISRLERDRHARPSIATVVALGKAFDVDPMSIQFGPPRLKARPTVATDEDRQLTPRRPMTAPRRPDASVFPYEESFR